MRSEWCVDLHVPPVQYVRQLRVTLLEGETLRFEEIINGTVRGHDITLPLELIFTCLPDLAVIVKVAADGAKAL